MPNTAKATGPRTSRKINVPGASKAAPANAKPASKPAKADNAPAVARKPGGNINRTLTTIHKLATNFGGVLSDRDNAYLAFYAGFVKRDAGKPVTVAAIHESGLRPAYNGSNKAHDAGVIVRLQKAGLVSLTADGFTFTDKAKALALYASAKPHPVAAAPAQPAKA